MDQLPNHGQSVSHPPQTMAIKITSVLPTTHKLSSQTSSNACFYSRFAGLSAIAVTCRLGPCVALRRRSFSRANLRENFVRSETCAGSERHYFFPVGTFCFN